MTEPAFQDDGADLEVRIDKWLQVARVFKTRSQANRACNLGRVRVDGQDAKSHRRLSIGERVEVDFGEWTRVLEVKVLRDKPVRKDLAAALYEDHSPPKPQLDEMEKLMRRAPAKRERGSGRPTKKQRRDMEKFLGG